MALGPYLRLFPASLGLSDMECLWPPAPARSARPPYDLPNLTCLAMTLEHGAVGDDIGLDLGLATGFELPGVRSWQPKACFSGRETRETLRFFYHQGGMVDFPSQFFRVNKLT